MLSKTKREEYFQLIYRIRKQFPHSDIFYFVFIVLMMTGIILSTHNIKGLENRGENKVTIASLLEEITLFQNIYQNSQFFYQEISIILFFLVLIVGLNFFIIFVNIKKNLSKITDISEFFISSLISKQKFIIFGKINTYIFLLIVFFSSHIFEYISFGVLAPIMQNFFESKNFPPEKTVNFKDYIENAKIETKIIACINLITFIIVWCYLFLFFLFNSTKSLFLLKGTSIYSSITVMVIYLIFPLFQALYSVNSIFNKDNQINYKTGLDICAICFLTLFLFLQIKKFTNYDSYVPNLIKFIAIWCWYSGITELFVRFICKKELSQIYSIIKLIMEFSNTVLIFYIMKKVNVRFFESNFSNHLFQPYTNKFSPGEIYLYLKYLDTYNKQEVKNYFKVFTLIGNHKKNCQIQNCICHVVEKHNQKNREKGINVYSKSDLIIICEQEIVNRICFLYKKKSLDNELSMYCVLHVQFIIFFKQHFYFGLYLINKYIGIYWSRLNLTGRYFLYEMKMLILHEFFKKQKKIDSRKLFLNEDSFLSKINIQPQIEFFSFILFTQTSIAIMSNICDDIEKIFFIKNEFKKNAFLGTQGNVKFDTFIHVCEGVMKNNAKLIEIFKRVLSKHSFTDNEICYYIYNFYFLTQKKLPKLIEGKIKDVKYHSNFEQLNNTQLIRHDLHHPILIQLMEKDNFTIAYIDSDLLQMLRYSKEKIINKDYSLMIPGDLATDHNLLMKQFLFIPNGEYVKDSTLILDNDNHLVDVSLVNKVFPHLISPFYIIADVKLKKDNPSSSLNYSFLLSKDFRILSICRTFEEQFGFNLKMLDILKMNYCEFFGVNVVKLKKKFKEGSSCRLKVLRNFTEENKATSVFTNIKPEKLFSYRAIHHDIFHLVIEPIVIQENIKKKQILDGLNNLAKTIEEIGLDIEWYNKVKYLRERFQIDGLEGLKFHPNEENNFFTVTYSQRQIGTTKYFLVKMIEHSTQKGIGLSGLLFKSPRKTSSKFMFESGNTPIGKGNGAKDKEQIQARTSTLGSEKPKRKQTDRVIDSNGNVSVNSTIQSSVSKISLISKGSPLLFKTKKSEKSFQEPEDLRTTSLKITDKNREMHRMISKKNVIFIQFIYFLFFCFFCLSLAELVIKVININTHKYLFYLVSYMQLVKTDVFLDSLIITYFCRRSYFNPGVPNPYLSGLKLQNKELNLHFTILREYLSMFTSNKKLTEFFGKLYQEESYKILQKNFNVKERKSSLIEEINMFHYSIETNSVISYDNCRVSSIFFKDGYLTLPKETTTPPNPLETLVFYVFSNLIPVINQKFDILIEESIKVQNDYYALLFRNVFIFDSLLFLLLIIICVLISEKIINDKKQIKGNMNIFSHQTRQEDIFINQINLFKRLLRDFKTSTAHRFEACRDLRDQILTQKIISSNSIYNDFKGKSFKNIMSPSSHQIKKTPKKASLKAPTINEKIVQKDVSSPPKKVNFSLFKVSSLISFSFLGILFVLLIINLFIISMMKESFIFSSIMSLNFLERIPSLTEMIFYSQQMAMVGNPNYFDKEMFQLNLIEKYINYYGIKQKEDDNSILQVAPNSYFHVIISRLIYLSNNINYYRKRKQKELKETFYWENKFNEKDSFCIESEIVSDYYLNGRTEPVKEFFKKIDENAKKCIKLSLNLHEFGLETEFGLYVQETTNLFVDFAKSELKLKDSVAFLRNNLMTRMLSTFQVSFRNLYQGYTYSLLLDLDCLYREKRSYSVITSLVIIIWEIGMFIYVTFVVVKKTEHLKKLLNFLTEIIYRNVKYIAERQKEKFKEPGKFKL